jgi:hypothetical protein
MNRERRKRNGFPQGLMRNMEKLQGSICKVKFRADLKPEEMPKSKVGEFFKLYNIALGLKFKNSKLIFLHMNLCTKVGFESLLS